jgi:carboxymethylenebutenolidase
MVEFQAGKARAQGFLSAPAGVVVLQEWWGLVPHVEDVAGRFAREGYLALAPDLYHGKKTLEAAEAQHLMQGLDWARAVEEIGGAVAHLRALGCARVGIVGFCMGGALSLLGAATAQADAAVAFYGFPPPPNPLGKKCPPSLVLFGEDEGFFDVPAAKAWAAEQRKLGVADTEVVIYPGAGHAFFNDTRPEAYHTASAQDAWKRTLRHFQQHLR